MIKRIGLLTSGGDCQALNATMRGVVKALSNAVEDLEVYGFDDGYKGLIYGKYHMLTAKDFSGILTRGGTILGTSRQPFKLMRVPDEKGLDKVEAMKQTYYKLCLDCLVILGGNGTQKTANLLREEGLNIIHLPKTIDNENEGYEPDIEVSVTDEEIETEYAGYRAESVSRALCESTCIYRAIARKMIAFQAFVMHGAVLELDGKAYVFTAKSGVGKTTHTKLWVEYFEGRASYINGDKPIIRCKDGVWYAYGTPWMGKEKFGSQSSAPIQAVCFIERGEENKIQKIADKEVIDRVFHQLFFPEDPETLIEFMGLADDFVQKLPFFVLKCNISAEAVRVAYETLSKV